MKKINTKLEEGILLYQQGVPMLKVCEVVRVSFSTLQSNLKKRGLSRSNKENSRKFHVDHDYFSSIDGPEKAYWLGFLYADGYITQSNSQKNVGVALKHSDADHLDKLRFSLNSNYEVKSYRGKCYDKEVEYSRLLMTSDKMFDDLNNLGVVERKSLILKFPSFDIVPERWMWHFVRGYFDGDGSFAKHPKGRRFKVCGTWEFLVALSEFVGKPSLKLQQRRKNRNTWQLDIGGNLQVCRIASKMYDEATVWLDRKHEIYKEFIV